VINGPLARGGAGVNPVVVGVRVAGILVLLRRIEAVLTKAAGVLNIIGVVRSGDSLTSTLLNFASRLIAASAIQG
jgi:Na+/H+-dicarboxylate symporter